MPRLSIIIPVINEAALLPGLLQALRAQRDVGIEILVIDGGSTDGSCEIAAENGAGVVKSDRGRASQMNAGARRATGECLLFLHADSRIEDPDLLHNALQFLQDEIHRSGNDRVAGHFRLRFDRGDLDHAMAWRYVEEKTAFNRSDTTNGDQGFLLTKNYFDSVGGFDETLLLLEDQRLAEHIRANGRWVTLPGVLHTSARRFEAAGFHNQYTLMALIMAMQAADMHGFFARTPDIYRAQHEAGRLLLTPYFRLVKELLNNMSWQERSSCWMRVGRLGRRNWWQLFYFFDVLLRPLLGSGRYPFMRAYERLIEPFVDNRPCDAVSALVLGIHFHLILIPLYRILEHRALQEADRPT